MAIRSACKVLWDSSEIFLFFVGHQKTIFVGLWVIKRTLASPSEVPAKFYISQEESSLSLKKKSGLAFRSVGKVFKKHSSPSSSGHQLGVYKCATCVGHFTKVTTSFRFLCVCAFILWTVLWMHTWAIWYLTLCWIILCLPFTTRLWHCHYEWNCEMRPWMHRTHPLMCIASQARLRLDNADAHLPTTQDNLDAKKNKMRILGICQFFSKTKILTVNFLRT